MTEQPDAATLTGQVERFPFPIGLIDLDTQHVVAVTRSALDFGQLSAEDVLEQPVLDRLEPDQRASTAAALEAMGNGGVDLVRARPLVLSDHPHRMVIAWLRRLDTEDRRLALFELADESSSASSPLVAHLGSEPFVMAVGALDGAGRAIRLSSAISRILDVDAAAIIGTDLVERAVEDDVDRLRAAIRHLGSDYAVGLDVRLRDGAGGWRPVHLVLASLRGADPERGFIVTPARSRNDQSSRRVADLEQRLWNIAREVEAAGIVMHLEAVDGRHVPPDAAPLTPRQWEVLAGCCRASECPRSPRSCSSVRAPFEVTSPPSCAASACTRSRHC
jgi:PAS domain-containing protein